MAKKKPPRGWVLSTPKKAKSPLPESTKTDLDAKAKKLVKDVLKPRYVQPPPKDARFNPEGNLATALGMPGFVLGKEGARTLRAGYQRLIQDHGIDAVILVDGGVDSLMRGDEEGPGTIIQDAVSLSVVNGLDVPTKILACIGFGAEADEDVCHYRALEDMAALAGDGSFLGARALTQAMESFQHYKTICEAIFEQGGDVSHFHTRVIPAVDGEFGQFQRYRHAAVMLLSPRPPFGRRQTRVARAFRRHAVQLRQLGVHGRARRSQVTRELVVLAKAQEQFRRGQRRC